MKDFSDNVDDGARPVLTGASGGAVSLDISASFPSHDGAAAEVRPGRKSHGLAAATTWLLSDDASNVSGAILSVEGGWTAV
jgi:hypothetical protein